MKKIFIRWGVISKKGVLKTFDSKGSLWLFSKKRDAQNSTLEFKGEKTVKVKLEIIDVEK